MKLKVLTAERVLGLGIGVTRDIGRASSNQACVKGVGVWFRMDFGFIEDLLLTDVWFRLRISGVSTHGLARHP